MHNIDKYSGLRAETVKLETWKDIEERHNLQFEITNDYEEAKEIVQSLIDGGAKVIITVPEEWINHVKTHGLSPQLNLINLVVVNIIRFLLAALGPTPILIKVSLVLLLRSIRRV